MIRDTSKTRCIPTEGWIRSGIPRVLLATCICTLTAAFATADPYVLADPLARPLGARARYMAEGPTPLTLEEAIQAQERGAFNPGTRAVGNFGIGARPVWAHAAVENPTGGPLAYHLIAGMTWIDQLDVYVVRDGGVPSSWEAGDSRPGAAHVEPGVGYVFSISFLPGRSELYIRAETADPLVLPLRLIPGPELAARERWVHYSYGMLYGFILALISFYAVLYCGLRSKSYLYYALYLSSFIVLNLAYTGHGFAWFWPGSPLFQRYVNLVMMVVFGYCGFLFMSHFLDLAVRAPAAKRWVDRLSYVTIGLLILFLALGSQLGVALLAFNFLLIFTAAMVGLGIWSVRAGHHAGRYFLGAALCAMAGAACTTLAVWGWLPFNALTFHGGEVGVALEASLLALALASRMRYVEQARKDAELLAHIDPLTRLPNRRGFLDHAAGLWSTAVRKKRPLCAVVLDIDHFKDINDQHGHEGGDRVLVEAARLLAQNCRAGDILARWGGEEFVYLLPETSLTEAEALSDRIRRAIEETQISLRGTAIRLTASLGTAERREHATLDELIREADQWLYYAKGHGRNQVASPNSREGE